MSAPNESHHHAGDNSISLVVLILLVVVQLITIAGSIVNNRWNVSDLNERVQKFDDRVTERQLQIMASDKRMEAEVLALRKMVEENRAALKVKTPDPKQ